MSTSVLLPGSVFAGRYRVEKCIAEGGMGAVYEVLHTETGRRHALKVMHAHTLSSAEMRDRFRQEARVAANVQSEFIVDVLDAGVETTNNLPFLVMELLQGEELGRLLERRGRFTPAETVTFLGQVAMALDKTHRAMIVHRDLKPENLFLTYRDDGAPRVKVLDFGVAKIVAETNTNAAATRSLGTPLYMAPEQFQPGNKVSPSTDLFALALIAYTFLVGQSYWAEDATASANVFSFALVAIHGPREPACARAARAGVALPPAFDAWFSRAASPDPSARFTSATAMIRALGELLSVPVPFRSSTGDPLGGSGSNPAFALPAPSFSPVSVAPHAATPGFVPPPPLAGPSGQPVFSSQPFSSAPALPARGPGSTSPTPLTISGAPTVASFAASPARTSDGLSTTGAVAPSGAGKKVLVAALATLLAGIVVALVLVIPKSNAADGSGAAAGSSTLAPDIPSPSLPATSVPTVVPAPDSPSAAPSSTATDSPPAASAPATADPAPTKAVGTKPKPKGPKPPGTSVYIRD